MKRLKIILVLTYIVIIILLLLSLLRCQKSPTVPGPVVIKEKFNADVVMCIDCTSSMYHLIGTIKKNALNFYPDIKKKCESQGKEILSMRIRVIAFRDFCDSMPFETSDFFGMPEKENDFKTFVSNLKVYGGGDGPERAYDAISQALLSDWSSASDVRKVVILWTDAPSHPLSRRNPEARTFDEMSSLWKTKLQSDSKRLILFAPSDPTWSVIENNWDKAVRHGVTSGGGLTDVDYNEILRALSESI